MLLVIVLVSKREGPPFAEDESSVQTIDTEELPLDYGGSAVSVSLAVCSSFPFSPVASGCIYFDIYFSIEKN